MLFKPTLIAAFAALACANPFPQDVEPRSLTGGLHMSLKWFAHKTCSHSGGPDRGYTKDTCLTLTEDKHGVKIRDKNKGCRLHAYASKDCKSETEVWSNGDCHSLKGVWSVKIKDCE